ncbi:MAG: hypothetical protein ABJX32_06205 [Tateyamaria sp.]|uniref:hypothetical protein n=1 Tax=Tateyamaria sp. TaxID=1929288 RepID=UPI0032A06994
MQITARTALENVRQIAGSGHILRKKSSEISKVEEAAPTAADRAHAAKARRQIATDLDEDLRAFEASVAASFDAIEDIGQALEILSDKNSTDQPATPFAKMAARLVRGYRVAGRDDDAADIITRYSARLHEALRVCQTNLAHAQKRKDASEPGVKETLALLTLHRAMADADFEMGAPAVAAARKRYHAAAAARKSQKGLNG